MVSYKELINIASQKFCLALKIIVPKIKLNWQNHNVANAITINDKSNY